MRPQGEDAVGVCRVDLDGDSLPEGNSDYGAGE